MQNVTYRYLWYLSSYRIFFSQEALTAAFFSYFGWRIDSQKDFFVGSMFDDDRFSVITHSNPGA